MKIRSVTTAVIEANFDWTLIRIECENGQYGYGESFFAPGLTAIIAELSELLVGRDARNILFLNALLRSAASGAGAVGGIIYNALSGIDGALWDLNARAAGLPLWQFLGGRAFDEVRVYADCHGGEGLMSLGPLLNVRQPAWGDDDAVVEGKIGATLFEAGAESAKPSLPLLKQRATEAVEQGFTALKFDLDVPGLVPEYTGSRRVPPRFEELLGSIISAIKEGAGPNVELAFDLHWRYDFSSAQKFARQLADHDILWLEDPLPPENIAGLIELSRATETPLGGGENLVGFRSFLELLDTNALDVVTPDLGKVGGVQEARRVAEYAADRGIAVAPHNIAGPIGTAFAAQVASTWPNTLALEFHAMDVPFFSELIGEELIIDGYIPMTDAPGIGVEPDLEVVRKWAKKTESVFGE